MAVYLAIQEFSLYQLYRAQTGCLKYILKNQTMLVLQLIVHGGSCFIQIDSGRGLNNMWTASPCAQERCIFDLQLMYIS